MASLQMVLKNNIISDLTAAFKNLSCTVAQQSSAAQGRPFSCSAAAANARPVSAAPNTHNNAQPQQEPAAPGVHDSNSSRSRVDIPIKPIGEGMISIENTWKEYMEGTESKPPIRHLIDDHGSEWRQKKYGYDRKLWLKKKKIICALEAIQQIESVRPAQAIKLLGAAQQRSGKALHPFASSLPNLGDDIDVAGKCKSSSGAWRSLHDGDTYYEQHKQYLQDIRKVLQHNNGMQHSDVLV